MTLINTVFTEEMLCRFSFGIQLQPSQLDTCQLQIAFCESMGSCRLFMLQVVKVSGDVIEALGLTFPLIDLLH